MVAVTKQHQLKKGFFFCNTFSSLLQSLVYINWIYHSSQPFGLSSIKRKVHVFVLFFYISSVRFFLYLGQQLLKKSLTFFSWFPFFCSLRGPFLRALHKRSFSSCTSLFFLFNWNALIAFIFHKI